MQDNKQSGIYCIENLITNKKYIGQSNNIHNRWRKHISELNRNSHFNDYLQNAWNKYGVNNFKFYVLEYCEPDKLDEREKYYIDLYCTVNRNHGYNLKSGGQTNISYSEETRKKMSISIQRSYLNPKRKEIQRVNALKQWKNPEIKSKIIGSNNGMYGKHHTDEAKQKVSNKNKGRKSARRNTTPVLCVELNKKFADATTAGKEMNLDSSGILKVCQNKRKTCGGYTWTFINIGE